MQLIASVFLWLVYPNIYHAKREFKLKGLKGSQIADQTLS